MAKSIEVAVDFLKKSIERGKYNSNYYMDFIKLQGLMYLAQSYIYFKYGHPLIDDKITINKYGFRVEKLDKIPAYCGFGKILNIDELIVESNKKHVLTTA